MWQDLVAWFQSPGGARVLQTAIIPALVILVAALVSALIARSAVRAMIRRSDRIQAASAVGALVAAARVVVAPNDDDASRLRTEADVRTRLLPLTGAGLAADWAAARIDALQQRPADHSAASELDELRDRLVAWVERPARAKRLFGPSAATPVPVAGAAPPEAVEPAIDESASVGAAGQERFSRPQPGPRRTPPPEESAAAAAPEVAAVRSTTARPPAPAPAAAVGGAVPAWQRTRAGERLQQERFKTRAVEPPTVDESEPVPVSTAPVQLSHPHRAASAPSADGGEAVRLEAHQQARHARPDEPQQAADGVAPAAPVTPSPGWLDSYDDEAQVTQNLDLTTPPPVAASAVRGRGSPGEDLVPRT